MHEKANLVCFIYMQPQKNEIQICSNEHETGLVEIITGAYIVRLNSRLKGQVLNFMKTVLIIRRLVLMHHQKLASFRN